MVITHKQQQAEVAVVAAASMVEVEPADCIMEFGMVVAVLLISQVTQVVPLSRLPFHLL